MKIRKANYSDTEGIAKVHVDSWRTTYKGIIPNNFLENLSYQKRNDLWVRNLSEENSYTFVAENYEGSIVGFISGNCNPGNL
ncbi:hypothetical protein [Piscibacillus halophilus]|uniref:GNAT family N-acetyltransferase n=1 Tax=Piscibacillus halophilus TaxID=571933 RepID=A0A1H9IJV4_9BACI|nr:hypothetical protein SAMN05216362_12524 [Piscibacillus halophilus]